MNDPQLYPWIILFAPLVAAGAILFLLPRNNAAAAWTGILTAALTCFLSWNVFFGSLPKPAVDTEARGATKIVENSSQKSGDKVTEIKFASINRNRSNAEIKIGIDQIVGLRTFLLERVAMTVGNVRTDTPEVLWKKIDPPGATVEVLDVTDSYLEGRKLSIFEARISGLAPGSATQWRIVPVGPDGELPATAVFLVNSPSARSAQIPWLEVPGVFSVPIGIILDNLSRLMLVVVTTIAMLVFIYSAGYMRGDEGIPRYYASLCLFLFSMLGIVLADNFVMMFIFWELVGVSSYLLIGHYFRKDSAADAAKQAFTVNRVGDFGFMLGILMLWLATGSVMFSGIEKNLAAVTMHPGYLTAACLLIFCGTLGKSAQMPLHVWLPNSMEGPTPVSSLLHAATMVAAGVYMLARIFPVLLAAPDVVREVIMWVGAITCFAAGLMATQQDDIKRILAYSTISQLGYMVVGIAVAPAGDVAMFHLFTHAFFKCMLFLCAGSVIIALHHEQNIWKMGGLLGRMPLTALCLVIGTLALTGTPWFSGYYSKDLIVAYAHGANSTVFWITAGAALLTSFYMFRLFFVVFLGRPRGEHAEHAKQSPAVMTIPLLLLAIPSLAAGYPFIAKHFFDLPHPEIPHIVHYALLAALIVGFLLAAALYARGPAKDPVRIPLFANRLYIDNFYNWLVANVQGGLAVLGSWFDRWIIDGLVVTGAARTVWATGYVLRLLQLGNLQAYAFFFGAGVLALLYFLILR